jgi:hypothetical protein
MNRVLLQHGVGPSAELLRLTRPCHAAWAKATHWDYIVSDATAPAGRNVYWCKPMLLEAAACSLQDGDLLAWLDPDCLIMTQGTLLAPKRGMAMARHRAGGWCTGAIYLRVGPEVKDLLHEWRRLGPLQGSDRLLCQRPDDDEARLNLLISRTQPGMDRPMDLIHTAAPEWNFARGIVRRPTDIPLVVGFHGLTHEEKLAGIRVAMEKCPWRR